MKRALTIVALVLLAGCTAALPSPSEPTTATPLAAQASSPPPDPDDLADPAAGLPYSCGGPPFDIRTLSFPPIAEMANDAAAQPLRDTISRGRRPGWWLTIRTDEFAQFLTRNGPRLFDYINVRPRGDGTWEWAGEGDCVATLYVDGRTTLRWMIAEGEVPGPETRIVRALVNAHCATVEPAALEQPIIRATREAVLVVFLMRGLVGMDARGRVASRGLHDVCVQGPSIEVELDFGERLGDRRLVDGATWPPRDAPQPFE